MGNRLPEDMPEGAGRYFASGKSGGFPLLVLPEWRKTVLPAKMAENRAGRLPEDMPEGAGRLPEGPPSYGGGWRSTRRPSSSGQSRQWARQPSDDFGQSA